jgi:hypothetical protein
MIATSKSQSKWNEKKKYNTVGTVHKSTFTNQRNRPRQLGCFGRISSSCASGSYPIYLALSLIGYHKQKI